MSDDLRAAAIAELQDWAQKLIEEESVPDLQPGDLTAIRFASLVIPSRNKEWAMGVLDKKVEQGELTCFWAKSPNGHKVKVYVKKS